MTIKRMHYLPIAVFQGSVPALFIYSLLPSPIEVDAVLNCHVQAQVYPIAIP